MTLLHCFDGFIEDATELLVFVLHSGRLKYLVDRKWHQSPTSWTPDTPLFRIKICGITTPEDALAAVRADVDALGLNFYPHSKRYLSVEDAMGVVRVIPSQVTRVGVFVNASLDQINAASQMLALDWIQLHGNESPEFISQLPAGVPLIRACRMDRHGLQTVLDDLRLCQKAGRVPDAVLIDAQVAGAYGGTGIQADWAALVGWRNVFGSIPLVLAGGLNSDNVAAAINQVDPVAVDTASGVESVPGRKDPECMRQFVAAARSCLRVEG